MTCEEIVDALAQVDPQSSDDGWTNCFFCLAMIEGGHEQHADGCLWAAARKLKGLPYAVEVRPAGPQNTLDKFAGWPADSGARRGIVGDMWPGLTGTEPKK